MFRSVLGLLIVLIGCSGNQQISTGGLPIDSGLQIDNGVNRGLSYTDSMGNKYNLRYIPITITNDSIIPIHIKMAFSNGYDYPVDYGEEKFHLFLFPKETGPEDVTWDSITYELGRSELRDFFDRGFHSPYMLNETIEPGEKCVVEIGTLYPSSPKVGGVLPNALFVPGDRRVFSTCDWLIKEDQLSDSQMALGLKLNFSESCTVIPCGHISYPER